MKDRQIDNLLKDHYDRITHPPQPDPLLDKIKSLSAAIAKARPKQLREKPEPQP